MNKKFLDILDNIDDALTKMILEQRKSDEQFKKQTDFLIQKYENDIRRIDLLLDLYNKKHARKFSNSI